ncbi:ABC transporter permease [Neisseria animaloris]|uniref:Putative transporter n=1 Tax=Neisseria animaloris TaxID=326522 RepID=A0A448UDS4_9NEIS|nr:iron ABC transporter permease [Neisseria animaloris]VEJ22014.1 putative transporter [Neisseria animaloris]
MSRIVIASILALLSLGFLAVMVIAPLIALATYENESLAWAVLQDDYIQIKIGWTTLQAAITCIFTLILGVPIAWVLARLDFRGRLWILRLIMLPFVMPTLVAGIGVLALFGSHGLLWPGWEDSPYLLLYGNIFFNLPVLIRSAYQGFLQVPSTRLYTAQTLGAETWQRFCHIDLPVLKPWLAGGLCLVFLYCFSGFGLALLLGGSHYTTIEVEIYQLVAYELDMAQAAVLVWIVLAITALAGFLYAYLSRHTASDKNIYPLSPKPAQTYIEKILLTVALVLLFACCGLPLIAILLQATRAGNSWGVLLEIDTLLAVWNTLRFTFFAMLIALLLGILHTCLARLVLWVRSLTFLPFMVSPICIAFGVLLLYPEWTASLPLLISTYALLAYPFIAKDLISAWDALPQSYTSAARSIGATPFQTALYVTIPLLLPALRRGLTLAAATCVGEFAATLFLSRPEWQTLTTLIYRHLSTAGSDNHDRAMVLTVFLMILALSVFMLLDNADRTNKVSTKII